MNRDGSKGAGVLMEDVRNTGRSSEKAGSDLEVPAKAKRRRFTAECKLRFVDRTPAAVYATLLEEGRYLCSIRTMYRRLKAAGEVIERRRHPHQEPPRLVATGPKTSTWPLAPSRIDRLGSRSSWAGQRAIQPPPARRPPGAFARISAVTASPPLRSRSGRARTWAAVPAPVRSGKNVVPSVLAAIFLHNGPEGVLDASRGRPVLPEGRVASRMTVPDQSLPRTQHRFSARCCV